MERPEGQEGPEHKPEVGPEKTTKGKAKKKEPTPEGEAPLNLENESNSADESESSSGEDPIEDPEKFYEVSKIVGIRKQKGRYQYLVKWKENGDEKFPNSWEDSDNLTKITKELYHEKHRMDGKLRDKYKRKRR